RRSKIPDLSLFPIVCTDQPQHHLPMTSPLNEGGVALWDHVKLAHPTLSRRQRLVSRRLIHQRAHSILAFKSKTIGPYPNRPLLSRHQHPKNLKVKEYPHTWPPPLETTYARHPRTCGTCSPQCRRRYSSSSMLSSGSTSETPPPLAVFADEGYINNRPFAHRYTLSPKLPIHKIKQSLGLDSKGMAKPQQHRGIRKRHLLPLPLST
ncbi:MAG: hypothetical protein K2P90_03125, partial [Holosporales bacterium]|nr:hypothetical protein [Holosporales bacterium]